MTNKTSSRNYHMIFIFSTEHNSPMEKLGPLFEQHQVTIDSDDVENWGEKPLFTPIRKEEAGVFVVASCKIPPQSIAQLNKDLKVRPELLHHMIKKISTRGKKSSLN